MLSFEYFCKHARLIEKINSIYIVSYYHDYVKIGGDDSSYDYVYLCNIDNEYLQQSIELCLKRESFIRNNSKEIESSPGIIKFLFHDDSNTIARLPNEGFCFNLNNKIRFMLLSEISSFYDEKLLIDSEANYFYSTFRDNKDNLLKIPENYWTNHSYNKILHYQILFERQFEITSNEIDDRYLPPKNGVFHKMIEFLLLSKENKEILFDEKFYLFYNNINPCEGFDYRPNKFIQKYYQHKVYLKGLL